MSKEYALYKGEDMLAMGTLDDIAAEMGVKRRTIIYYGTPSYEKRGRGNNKRKLIRLD